MLKAEDLFDLSLTPYADIFQGCEYAWEAIPKIRNYCLQLLEKAGGPAVHGEVSPLAYVEKGNVYIGPGTKIDPGVQIHGPAYIDRDCHLRHGAYVRGEVIIGPGSTYGNSCEIKNSLLLSKANMPHFLYVGDSILGNGVHLGAGVKISNVKLIRTPVVVQYQGRQYETGLIKFGTLIGDFSDVGCNSVLNPGTILGKQTVVYTNCSVRGVIPHRTIVKMRQQQEMVERRMD